MQPGCGRLSSPVDFINNYRLDAAKKRTALRFRTWRAGLSRDIQEKWFSVILYFITCYGRWWFFRGEVQLRH